MRLYLDDGKQLADASAKAIKLPKADQYQLQGENFSRVVRGTEKLAFGVPDAIKQAGSSTRCSARPSAESGKSRRTPTGIRREIDVGSGGVGLGSAPGSARRG